MEATYCPSEGKARQTLTIIRKLAGTTQGTDGQILKTSYQGIVKPNREYISSSQATTAKDIPGTTLYHRSHENDHEGTPSSNVIQESGAGIAIYFLSCNTEAASAVTQIHYSNYKAESETLMMAISRAEHSQQKSTVTVFITDALSGLQALTNSKLSHLAKALQLLSNNCRVVVQWIPAIVEY